MSHHGAEACRGIDAVDIQLHGPHAIAALKLCPLLFVRPGELRVAEWAEIDFGTAEWRIPAKK
ncbi:hypothetical protein [Glaciimonas sp. PCH181]|uniref:hypothetical protein n=1 Tax=Glaciimonas sp. PCH181 TaxID=2133943 RepID=UPI000D3736D3|nr:hypothetical protein [Glaciimonas sp. PCH181]PUA17106.1 hypothetical protein C7W93_14235 [Glaciimonas sp. PCH181]